MEIIRKRTAQTTSGLVGGIGRWAQAAEMVAEVARGRKQREVRRTVKKYGLLAAYTPKRTSYAPLNSGLALTIFKLQRQVDSFRSLPVDWDGYGAFPTAKAAIRQAVLVLNSLLLQLGSVRGISMHVFPMRDGGVQIDLDREGSSLEIEVHPDASQRQLLFTEAGDLIGEPTSLTTALRQFTAQPRSAA